MGRSIHIVDGLIPPISRVDERLATLPRGSDLYVLAEHQSYKILFFLKVDHILTIQGHSPMRMTAGDILIVPFRVTQIYKSANAGAASRIHALRMIFDLPLLPPDSAARKKSSSEDSGAGETNLEQFIHRHFDMIHHLPGGLTPAMLEMLTELRNEAEIKKVGHRLRIGGLCMEIIVEIVRQLGTRSKRQVAVIPSKSDIAVQGAKEYVMGNYSKPITLEEIAWHVRLSREHLARIFREVTGQTVFDYLTQIRVENAKILLCDGDLLVHEIGSRTGFGSPTIFGRIFKRVTGTTPLDYRKRSVSGVKFSPSIHRAVRP